MPSKIHGRACSTRNRSSSSMPFFGRRKRSTQKLDGKWGNVVEHLRSAYIVSCRNVEALVVRFTYGRKPDEKYTALAREVMHQTSIALQPGRWAVNFYPARRLCHAHFCGERRLSRVSSYVCTNLVPRSRIPALGAGCEGDVLPSNPRVFPPCKVGNG